MQKYTVEVMDDAEKKRLWDEWMNSTFNSDSISDFYESKGWCYVEKNGMWIRFM